MRVRLVVSVALLPHHVVRIDPLRRAGQGERGGEGRERGARGCSMCSLYRNLPRSLSFSLVPLAPLLASLSSFWRLLFLDYSISLSLVAEGSSLVPLPSVVHPTYSLDSDSHYLLPLRSSRGSAFCFRIYGFFFLSTFLRLQIHRFSAIVLDP